MARAHFLRRALFRCVFALALLGPGAACRVTGAKLWNLREVHRPDGSTKYTGRIHGDAEHLLRRMFDLSGFRGGALPEPDKKIDDPLSECLENVVELGGCDLDDPASFFAAIETISWLATDCHYPLSRERCVLELDVIGRRLGLTGPRTPPEPAARVEDVSQGIEELTRAVTAVVATPPAPAEELPAAADRVAGLALDLSGARRLLTVADLLAARLGEGSPTAAALLDLRIDLARRCVGFALGSALVDPAPRVRVAALRTVLDLDPASAAARLDAALEDDALEVRIAAVRLLGRSARPPEGPAGRDVAGWEAKLVEYLRASYDGEFSVALCKTLGRWTGRPRDLHPEAWVEWWEDQSVPAGAPKP